MINQWRKVPSGGGLADWLRVDTDILLGKITPAHCDSDQMLTPQYWENDSQYGLLLIQAAVEGERMYPGIVRGREW